MSLISLNFFIFLSIVVVLYYLVPLKYRWGVLLAASAWFYIASSGTLAIFLLLSIISIYIVGILLNEQSLVQKCIPKELSKEEKKIQKQKIKRKKKWIIIGGIAFNFGILLFLKYFSFFASNINAVIDILHLGFRAPLLKFALPLGISYYTLQATSYIIDVYRGKYEATRNFGKVALFLSFFPQMTEGPIGRFDHLAKQLYDGNKYQSDNIKIGIYLIIWGLFKKLVIADRAALFVNTVFDENPGGFIAFVAVALYTLQIYAEFSGAMDLVRGASHLFGVSLAHNFERPFFSKSIQEFWRRWHITLGAWLKDYVFYSVSLSKLNMKMNANVKKKLKGNFAKFIITAFPLFFVWFFNGFWHGATWKFILYGLYYYFIMMLGVLLQPYFNQWKEKMKINTESNWWSIFAILRTIIIVMGGMLIFRSPSLGSALKMLISMVTSLHFNILDFGLSYIDFIILLGSVLILLLVSWLQERSVNIYYLIEKKHMIRYSILFVAIMVIIILGIYGDGYNASDFIYGEF